MEVFLSYNGFELSAPADEAEKVILAVGEMAREPFTAW